ncbi:MAG: DUF6356 family protein [Actinomycetota bacterium]|nr:DUF6356 family protein [Actinomycetota bacterium]
MGIRRAFTEHPASVGETYGQHMRVAVHFAKECSLAAGAAAVHAVVPAVCRTSASDRIKKLHREMTSGARAGTAEPFDPESSVSAPVS